MKTTNSYKTKVVNSYNESIRIRREQIISRILTIRPEYDPQLLETFGKEKGCVPLVDLFNCLVEADKATQLFTLYPSQRQGAE